MTPQEQLPDPYLILDLPEDADQAAIRAAYTAAIKTWPPEKDPARFQLITQAYQFLSKEDMRTTHKVLGLVTPTKALTDLVPRQSVSRNRIGIQPWMDLIRQGSAHER